MPTYIRLASLTDQGVKNVRNLSQMLAEAKQVMAKRGVKLVQGWVTLGDYDIVAIIDAPDGKAAAEASALIAAQGNFRAKTVEAIPISEFSEAVKDG